MNKQILISSLIFSLAIGLSYGQETLKEKYDRLLETTETYEQYKVIPRARLNALWSEVTDSLNRQSATIRELRKQVAANQSEVEALKSELAIVKSKLEESLIVSDTIRFLGIPFSKLGYHVTVWSIIVALVVVGVLAYLMYLRSNKVTSKTRREYEILVAEYEDYKTKAREKQVKLKRELQTAINQLNERR